MTILLRKIHKWLSLVIGLQVLFWLLSGVIMAQLDPQKVSGEAWQQITTHPTQILTNQKILEPWQLPPEVVAGARRIRLEMSRHQPVYRITGVQGDWMIHASDGSRVKIDQPMAARLAQADFSGTDQITSITTGSAPDQETRDSKGDFWRVDFADQAHTSIYVATATGDILERRNRYWRIFDFAWMLHIMDYSNRKNFNNPVIILVSLIAFWLGLSGIILLFSSFCKKDFSFLRKSF